MKYSLDGTSWYNMSVDSEGNFILPAAILGSAAAKGQTVLVKAEAPDQMLKLTVADKGNAYWLEVNGKEVLVPATSNYVYVSKGATLTVKVNTGVRVTCAQQDGTPVSVGSAKLVDGFWVYEVTNFTVDNATLTIG